MSSTSSEEQKDPYENVQKAPQMRHSPEDQMHPGNQRQDDGRDRKRRRIISERAREADRALHLDHYPTARTRDSEGNSHHRHSDAPHLGHVSSRDPSMSRSESRSRSKSPASALLPPARVGKRLRRAPQRWEGERREPRATRSVPGLGTRYREPDMVMHRDSDDEATLSANSFQYEPEAPKMDDPVKEMRRAVAVVSTSSNRRLCVDAFHTWQLQSVSKQAAQQKALHVFLKRKLRKRTTRAPEIERLEDDALRNARTAPLTSKEQKSGRGGDHYPTDGEDEDSKLVPLKLRLPLEAYLPRRAKASRAPLNSQVVLSELPVKPLIPEDPVADAESESTKWHSVATVTTTSSLNKHKASSKYNKLHAAGIARKAREPERQVEE